MDVFVSWSGEPSRIVASALRDNLSTVIQGAVGFMSSVDIRSGARWFAEVGQKLNDTNYGIICLSPDNLESRWIHFESGALAKNLATSRVCCYLLDVPHSDVLQPLSQFHNRSAKNDDTWKLLVDVNKALPEGQRVEENGLRKLFDNVFWPEVEKAIELARKEASQAKPPSPRTDSSKIDEMLDLLRAIASGMQKRRGLANIETLQRSLLLELERAGRVGEMRDIVHQMDTNTLETLTHEIECGPLCDVVLDVLDRRGGYKQMDVERESQS